MPRKKPRPKDEPFKINQIEAAYCHHRLQGKMPMEAAEAIGLDPKQGPGYEQRVAVAAYMERYAERFLEGMVQIDVMKAARMGLTRESILKRLWQLANIPPHETRGSIDGQVNAVIQLADLMGYKFDPKTLPAALAGMTEEELRAFTASGPTQ